MEETFVVKIKQSQHATWQGSVDWISQDGKQKSQFFRSALELICLIDSAVDRGNCRSWETEEDFATCKTIPAE